MVGPGDLQQLQLANELLFGCGAFCHFEPERRFSARAALVTRGEWPMTNDSELRNPPTAAPATRSPAAERMRRRRERLTVEKLGADCIDVRMLNRTRRFTDDPQRVRFGLGWPRLSGMVAYRYRLELQFG